MTDDTQIAEELLQQSKQQQRHRTEPSDQSEQTPPLEEAVRQAHEAIESGDRHENLTIRDEKLAALFLALEETGDLESVGIEAADALGRDTDGSDNRATVLRRLIRVGLTEVSPDVVEAAKEGRKQHLANQADEF